MPRVATCRFCGWHLYGAQSPCLNRAAAEGCSWFSADDRETLDRIAARRVEQAAPALLEALKHLVHRHDHLSPSDVAMAEAVIAQAEEAS